MDWGALATVVGHLHRENRLDDVAAAGSVDGASSPASHQAVVDYLSPTTSARRGGGRGGADTATAATVWAAAHGHAETSSGGSEGGGGAGEPPRGACPICEECVGTFRSVVELSDVEQFEKDVCEHYFCIECIGHWVVASLERSARFFCPAEGCTCLMMLDDVGRLDVEHGTSHGEQMHTMMHAEHSTMHDAINEDPAVAAWVAENTAECPACRVIIERSAGCDEMVCHCGERFSYQDAGGPATEYDE